jgi:type IV pilus assembly protein PilW
MRTIERAGGEAGMTLIELLIVLGVFAIVMGTLATTLFSSTQLGTRTWRRAEVQGTARQALSLMTTEIRQAGADPSLPPAGIVGIVSADSVSIRIRADLSGDGVLQTAEPSEDVAYAYNAGSRLLTRDPGTGAAAVAGGITALRLTYFDSSNNPLLALPLNAADAARVAAVGVTLTCEERDSKPITLTSRISLRNR